MFMGYVSFRESILLKGEKNRVFFFHIDVFFVGLENISLCQDCIVERLHQVNSFGDFMDCHPSGEIKC